jgi:hypothetical protein
MHTHTRTHVGAVEITDEMFAAGAEALMYSGYKNEFMDVRAEEALAEVLAAMDRATQVRRREQP